MSDALKTRVICRTNHEIPRIGLTEAIFRITAPTNVMLIRVVLPTDIPSKYAN